MLKVTTHCNLSNISDVTISKTKATKSMYESNLNSDWSTAINLSPSLCNSNGYLALESAHKLTSKFNHYGQSFAITDRSIVAATEKLLSKEYTKLLNFSLQHSGNNSQKSIESNLTKKQKQFVCTFCDFHCPWPYDLKIHLKQKHNISKWFLQRVDEKGDE